MFDGQRNLLPCIKVRNNSRVGWKKGNFYRNLSVLAQKKDLQEWEDSVRYEQRWWIVETVFSCLKIRKASMFIQLS